MEIVGVRKVASMEEGHIHNLKVLGRNPENPALQHKARNGASQALQCHVCTT